MPDIALTKNQLIHSLKCQKDSSSWIKFCDWHKNYLNVEESALIAKVTSQLKCNRKIMNAGWTSISALVFEIFYSNVKCYLNVVLFNGLIQNSFCFSYFILRWHVLGYRRIRCTSSELKGFDQFYISSERYPILLIKYDSAIFFFSLENSNVRRLDTHNCSL